MTRTKPHGDRRPPVQRLRTTLCGDRRQEQPGELFEEELSGTRPPPLVEVRPQDRVQQHTLEHAFDICPFMQMLDAPVPLTVEQLVDVLQIVDALVLVAEQVIEVPKIILENILSRLSCREPQLAEQLVEVPTI